MNRLHLFVATEVGIVNVLEIQHVCLFPPIVALMPAVSVANFLTYVAQFMVVAVPPFGLVVRGSSLCRR